MKRCHVLSIVTVLLVSLFLLIGCGGGATADVADDASVQGIGGELSESDLALLMEVFGMSEEEIAALDPEEREIMLAEAGYDMSHMPDENGGAQNNGGAAAQSRPTLSDVSAGGSWVVTIGDSLWWNYIELHYENGVLVRIVTHFQKSSEEEPEIEVLEGDAARAYSFYWIDFSADPATVAAELADKVGYTSVAIERAQ